ncbi:MAG: hypothetical protein WB508_02060 [Aeromicrobium sp.]|uniref:hypothetical protein n=1 Tax=Aeromicrobium sp. TaxID=1871063 RepID=UPI003C57F832
MGLFRRRSRTDGGAVISDRASSRADLAAMKDWAEARSGVEAFIEPKTSVTQTTLLLVAGTGESIRRRVPSPQAAREFARKKLNVPVYDANLVGLPQRKREYDLRKAKGSSGSAGTARPTSAKPSVSMPGRSSREMAAIMTLESAAGVDPLPSNPTFDQLMKVYKQARVKSHPDRNAGDRATWDKVEDSARALDLPD